MERIFKIRCSQIGKIMGRVGLTENQTETMEMLSKKEKRTAIQEKTLSELVNKYNNPELPQTAKTYLQEWYANDNEQIWNKYLQKGNYCEQDIIDMACRQLNLGFVVKNYERKEDEFITGEPDVIHHDLILDVKSSWNNTTLQRQAVDGINEDYEMQLKGYCHLFNKPKGILFFGLVNTPEEANYNIEVIYDDIPETERWIAYQVSEDKNFINEVIERVKMCREYLVKYDAFIKSKIGKIN